MLTDMRTRALTPADGPIPLNRRRFLQITTAGLGCWMELSCRILAQNRPEIWDPHRPLLTWSKPLTIQPIFMFRLPVPKEASSWKSWGGIQTEEAVLQEVSRITRELTDLQKQAEVPLEILPVAKVSSVAEAQAARDRAPDVVLVYPCTGSGDILRSCFNAKGDTLIFVRHRSGPVYYWYEALSVKYLETSPAGARAASTQPAGVHVDDVVVDDYGELLWRLRALSAVHSLRATRIVALGGVWGKYSPEAPARAREHYGLDIAEVSYEELGRRIEKALADRALLATAEKWVDQYLALPGTSLETERPFVTNAFVLYRIFKDLLQENSASAFTVKSCMGTILPMSKTTACLSLSLLNDEGWLAFCESDFVIIPAGVLLRHLSGKPVFLHNSTFPHAGLVTCAHCTSPRRMDGKRYEPARLLTHYESEYGAAPKVEMPPGQQVTFLNPEYAVGRWLGFRGRVQSNPFYDICRSQQDVAIDGKWRQLIREVRDSHWVMAYGDYLREAGYAARKLGLVWENISDS